MVPCRRGADMKLSMNDVSSGRNPYQIFIDAIRSEQTARKYKGYLRSFLKVVPNEVYSPHKIVPISDGLEDQTNAFVMLAKKDTDLVTDITVAFVRKEKELPLEQAMFHPYWPFWSLVFYAGILTTSFAVWRNTK